MNGRTNGSAGGDALDTDTAKLIELAGLDPVAYDRQRKDAAKDLGISVKTLDAEVIKRRPKDIEARGANFLATVEPWPEAINGVQLLDDLADVVTRHVGLPEGGADAVALWAVHAHALDSAAITPLLAITSPTPECGKSTLLGLIGKLAPNPLPASNITSAAVFEPSKNGTRLCLSTRPTRSCATTMNCAVFSIAGTAGIARLSFERLEKISSPGGFRPGRPRPLR